VLYSCYPKLDGKWFEFPKNLKKLKNSKKILKIKKKFIFFGLNRLTCAARHDIVIMGMGPSIKILLTLHYIYMTIIPRRKRPEP
jgi:hypothetical protein